MRVDDVGIEHAVLEESVWDEGVWVGIYFFVVQDSPDIVLASDARARADERPQMDLPDVHDDQRIFLQMVSVVDVVLSQLPWKVYGCKRSNKQFTYLAS